MKISHSEVIKFIKELENRKGILLRQERSNSTFIYQTEESKIVPTYSYEETRREVDALDEKIRRLRHALAVANCTVKVEGFGVTIGEALVMLAQLQNKAEILSEMAARQQKVQQSSFAGKMEITECNYDVKQAARDYEQLRLTINSLQVAIDRANLLNTVEVDL